MKVSAVLLRVLEWLRPERGESYRVTDSEPPNPPKSLLRKGSER